MSSAHIPEFSDNEERFSRLIAGDKAPTSNLHGIVENPSFLSPPAPSPTRSKTDQPENDNSINASFANNRLFMVESEMFSNFGGTSTGYNECLEARSSVDVASCSQEMKKTLSFPTSQEGAQFLFLF